MSQKTTFLRRGSLLRSFCLLALLWLTACSPTRDPYIDKAPATAPVNSTNFEISPTTPNIPQSATTRQTTTVRNLFYWEITLIEAGCLFDSEWKSGIQIGGVPIGSKPIWACPRYTDLSHADLSQANLEGAQLTATDLTGADLHGANLTRAHMSQVKLVGANLTGADLTWASLTNADLTDANFQFAILAWASMYLATLAGTDLTGADTYMLSPEPDPSEVIGYTPWR
jgi:uncharacterized protein YjbI with pentapeptide repeats